MSFQLRTTDEVRRGRRRVRNIFLIVIAIIILAFATPLRVYLSPTVLKIISPFFSTAGAVKGRTSSAADFFRSKSSLIDENKKLAEALETQKIKDLDYERLKEENASLLNLADTHGENFLLSRVIRTPDSSPYDTIITAAGEKEGVVVGSLVFVHGLVPIGMVERVYSTNSQIKLFSTPGETHDILIGEEKTKGKATGRGAGNFESILPRGTKVAVGDMVYLSGWSGHVFATVEDLQETQGGTFMRILFKNPVSFSNLEFVAIEKIVQ